MTLNELKAFIEGMDVQGAPTPEQWARIKEKLETTSPVILGPVPHNPLYPDSGTVRGPDWHPYTTC